MDFLARQGVPQEWLRQAVRLAASRGTEPSRELLALGFDPERYFSLLAADLGIAFVDRLDDAEIVANVGLLAADAVRLAACVLVRFGTESLLVVAPQPNEIALLRRHLDDTPRLAARIRVATPDTIRGFIVANRHAALTHYAVNRLANVLPPLSARGLIGARGASGTTALVAAAIALALLAPVVTLKAFALLGTAFFFNCSFWKMAAAFKRPRQMRVEPVSDHALPTYTVLVPLYREAEVAADLVRHMRRIDYPALCIKRTKRCAEG